MQAGRRSCLAAGAASLLPSLLAACAGDPVIPPPARPAVAGPTPFSVPGSLGTVPRGWRPHAVRRDRDLTDYRVVWRQGRQVLEANARGSTSGLSCDVDIDPRRTPWLSWGWQVDRFPMGTSIADDEKDDSPARVILVFDGDMRQLSMRDRAFAELVELVTGQALPFAMLMYAWDGEASPEQVIAYPRSSRIQYLVVERGQERAGRWLAYRRNVREDYRRVFGAEPGHIRQVGVLCDGDDLKLDLTAWFGDLAFD